MKPRRKFPFTGHIVTRFGNVLPSEFTRASSWGVYDTRGRHFAWSDVHQTVAHAVLAGRQVVAEAEEKIGRLQALQDARRINLDKALEKGPAS